MGSMAVQAGAGLAMAGGNLSSKLAWELANPKWAATLNPVVSNPIVGGNLLQGVALTTGVNTINHGLGDKLQGYIVVMKNANITIYDSQSTNPRPQLTLVLNASGPATVSLYVF